MKKLLNCGFLLAIVSVFAVGCGCSNSSEKKVEDYENLMKEYGTTYYNNYMVGVIGQDENVITIEMLENAVKANGDKFDLDKLKDCDKTSSVTITSNKEDRKKIDKYSFDLKCD